MVEPPNKKQKIIHTSYDEDYFELSYTDLFRYERNAMHYYDKQFLFKSQYV